MNPQTPKNKRTATDDSADFNDSAISLPFFLKQEKADKPKTKKTEPSKESNNGLGPPIWSDAGAFEVKGLETSSTDENIEMQDAALQDNEDDDIDFVKSLNLDPEWLGTSRANERDVMYMQASGHLDELKTYRGHLIHDIGISPYDPALHIDLSSVDFKLGYTDTAVSHAYHALLLIEAGLKLTKITSIPKLGALVRFSQQIRFRTTSTLIIEDELQSKRLEAYQFLVDGLKGCEAYWDGLQEASKALKLFPGDSELLELKGELLREFKAQHQSMIDGGCVPEKVKSLTRSGELWQKPYPWMQKNLNWRTPAHLRDFNKNFDSLNCEVRPVVFGTAEYIATESKKVKQEGEDVGPLGIFATKDIKKGESVLVDKTLLGVSDIPSSKLETCDACQASLRPPYMTPGRVVVPKCCSNKVAYCSKQCHDTAVKGYHSVLCGKDFDWIYTSSTTGSIGKKPDVSTLWRPLIFLRVLSVLLTDKQHAGTHPLQHPLVARMTANYPWHATPKSTYPWQFFENVVAPTHILLQLGINVFKSPVWTQSTIQTLYWRLENNASQSYNAMQFLLPSGKSELGPKTNNVSLNPNYLFFNHSCVPNVNWNGGAIPNPNVQMDWLAHGTDGEFEKAGCSTVMCHVTRDVKEGEELKISYVGDPLGGKEGRAEKRFWMGKWFENGCGCVVCEKENENVGTGET